MIGVVCAIKGYAYGWGHCVVQTLFLVIWVSGRVSLHPTYAWNRFQNVILSHGKSLMETHRRRSKSLSMWSQFLSLFHTRPVALMGTSVMRVSVIIFDKFSILLSSSSPNNYGLRTDFGWCPEADSGYEFTADVSSTIYMFNGIWVTIIRRPRT